MYRTDCEDSPRVELRISLEDEQAPKVRRPELGGHEEHETVFKFLLLTGAVESDASDCR